ncbi:hypothetical protein CHS0354_023912 [Potamilus streckersoni]|uniref:Fibronectin type-III domain-containing protein n=1 Tax=Potamilus streckersoni TaxID=2493646 RepID=A0AAE0RZG7_9BIVA|nr:hypothetical protein CHS0354_023912 [Potamilus streckersoni]
MLSNKLFTASVGSILLYNKIGSKIGTQFKALTLLLFALSFFAGGCPAPTPVPDKPTLTITSVTTTQIDLSWSKVNGATSYSLYLNGSTTQLNDNNSAELTYSHKNLTPNSKYTYTLKACNSEGCSAASDAIEVETLTQVTVVELTKGDGTRDRYGAFKITALGTLNNYRLAVREASEAKPTAIEMEAGYHFKRNLSTAPKYLIITNRLDKTNVPLFAWAEAGKNMNSLGTNMLSFDHGLYDNTATGDNRFIEKSLLKPSTNHKLYGKAEGKDDVVELLSFTTDSPQSIIEDANDRLNDTALVKVTFSMRKDEHLIIPLQQRTTPAKLNGTISGVMFNEKGDKEDWKERYSMAIWMVKIMPSNMNNLTKPSSADCFQIRSISDERFLRKVGEVESECPAPAPASYVVKFSTDGGSAIADITVAHGSKATKPTDPTREGYAFADWYKEAALTIMFDFATEIITANITLYAKWTQNQPTITSFSPTTEGAGKNVTITGTNFSTTPPETIVKFNNVAATVVSATATQIVATVPIGATTGKITLTIGTLTVTSATDFTVIQPGDLIRTFSTTTGQQHTSYVRSVAFSPDGTQALSGSSDKTIKLWKVSDGSLIHTFSSTEQHTSSVFSVTFSPDGTHALSGSADNTIKLWRVSDGSLIRTFSTTTGQQHTSWVNSVVFSPDGTQALSGSDDKTIKLWRVSDGSLIHTFSTTGRHVDNVNSVVFSPDGTQALSGSDDKTIKLWKVSDGSLIRTFSSTGQHTQPVYSVAFSPDGTQALSGSADNTIKLWRVSDGSLIRTFSTTTGQQHTSWVNSVVFSPDGTQALSGSDDKTIKLWRVSDGSLIRTFSSTGQHTQPVYSVAFSPDGTQALSGSADNTIKLWQVK